MSRSAPIELDLPELGAKGPAKVEAVEPLPPIQSGPGHVITGTFAHRSSNQLLNITVECEAKPIGVTDNHPIWSEDRQEFVEAGQLEVGESLLTLAGPAPITSIQPRGPPEPVYNLEIHGEHVYCVTTAGVLVHNTYPHRNRANSSAPNEGYAIINRHTGEIYKFGVTARGVNRRFAEQADRIARLENVSRSDLELTKLRDFKNRTDALKWENQTVGSFRQLGHKLPRNLRPKGEPF